MNLFRKKITLLLALSLTLVTTGICQNALVAESAEEERVAVVPFETRGFSPEEGIRLKQSFATGLAESKRFDVMPDMVFKNNLEHVGISNVDSCNAIPCLAQLGNVLKVEKVVHVQAERWEQRFVLHIRLIRSSDAALLYDERVDYSGDINTLLTTIAPEQGRKLAAAFLDKKPNWILIGAAVLVGVGLIYWLFKSFGSMDSTVPEGNQPVGPAQ
jgi:uncharacterized protein YjeT (DUF2065 family)